MKRIRIRTFADARTRLQELGLTSLAELFIRYEATNQQLTREEVVGRMATYLGAMRESLRRATEQPNRTASGLIDGGASKVASLAARGGSLVGPQFSRFIQNLLAVGEHNACMGRIVAAPTAGAAASLPGAYLGVAELHQVPEQRVIEGLFVAGGLGEIISLGASLSGSRHGCQAEAGSASAMTAGAIASLFTADVTVIESAAAIALKNMLGLVCDPVGGLVEVPCVKRGVMAGLNAIASAEMALAGITTTIPFDEVVVAMAEIGQALPVTLKETALGGLAATPSGRRVKDALVLTQPDR
ncbi:MAG: L-serine ammonia-lyase, iron-sulfur-dependent, subunit alpha [Chitinophagales bacterium]